MVSRFVFWEILMNFKENDPFGLKKLDKDLTKIFSSKDSYVEEKKQSKSKKKSSKEKLVSKNTEQNLILMGKAVKITVKEIRDIIQWLIKIANKNKIPGTYDEIIAMRDSLKLAESRKIDTSKAIQEIKELQNRAKTIHQLERDLQLLKFKRMFHL